MLDMFKIFFNILMLTLIYITLLYKNVKTCFKNVNTFLCINKYKYKNVFSDW